MEATTPEEVAEHLLPHVGEMLGSGRAALVDGDGRLIGAYGDDPGAVVAGPNGSTAPVRLPSEAGALLVWLSPHTAFFGQEEIDLLSSLRW